MVGHEQVVVQPMSDGCLLFADLCCADKKGENRNGTSRVEILVTFEPIDRFIIVYLVANLLKWSEVEVNDPMR